MALIEREEALRDLEGHEYSTDCELEDDKAWARGFNAGIAHARHHLIYQSAVDAEPVVHARWVEKDDAVMHCSRCDRVGNPHIDNYCPKCGAKMDQEVKQ